MRRRTPRPDPVRNGEYLTAMDAKLTKWLRAHCPMTAVDGWESRRHLTREQLIALHEEEGVRWWHAGEGTVTQGAWVVAPSLVMAEREER